MAAVFFFQSCSSARTTSGKKNNASAVSGLPEKKLINKATKNNIPARNIDTRNVPASEVVQFAETLIGVKYKYGSAVLEKGFDCSGFINYVFNHFEIKVPRSSVDFTNAGTIVNAAESKRGDLILFTGSDTSHWIVGHMGIITKNDRGSIQFIHAASGNDRGVMISGMSNYFITRFVKVIRIFN